jgi:hypothetical protein
VNRWGDARLFEARRVVVRVSVYLMRPIAAAAFVLCCTVSAQAQAPAPDGVLHLLDGLERLLLTSDAGQLGSLLSPNVAPGLQERIGPTLFTPNTTRAVVREREREPLNGARPGDGFRLVVDVMTEATATARIVTLHLDVRRAAGDPDPDAWRIVSAQPMSLVDGLHRLEVDSSRQFAARNLEIVSEDLTLTLAEGTAFVVDSGRGTTGLVLIGRGRLRFSPGPQTERDQLSLFAGSEALSAEFEVAVVKMNPEDFRSAGLGEALAETAVNSDQLRRAVRAFEDVAPNSFNLDLDDLSTESWYLLPPRGDLLAEVQTRRHGTLTYARSGSNAEDVSLFERSKGRDIARYASERRLRSRGRFYSEDDFNDYDVLDYDVDVSVNPDRGFIDARVRLRIKVRAEAMGTLSLKLAEPLSVSAVTSPRFGRLTHLRVRTRDSVVVSLPVVLRRGTEVTVAVSYSGFLPSQSIDQESVEPPFQASRYYLLSGRSHWYPQPAATSFSTATIRVTVPEGYACVGSGELAPGLGADVSGADGSGTVYGFRALEPVRYLAILVGRFKTAVATILPLPDDVDAARSRLSATRSPPPWRGRDQMSLRAEAQSHLQGNARELSASAADVTRFYASMLGAAPYPALTVALVEHPQQGGHSPPFFVMLHNPPPFGEMVRRNDPSYFRMFPEFVLAHEIAHQWWGHAVGFKNYHEQWLSEGFAQYFSALYAQEKHGPAVFDRMVRQFRKWSIDESDQGPVHLGYRLGQMRGDRRVFRGLVYNKGAAVLHMLRRLVGDDTFFASLRRFYGEHLFEKADTDDLRVAFEAESGLPLGRFFDRWIYESAIPRIGVQTTVADREVVVVFTQLQDALFDVPVTVTLVYADGKQSDVIVPVTEAVVERRIPVAGPVRRVHINRDWAAVAEFED